MRDLRIKVRIYELKLNRLIKSHLSQNRSKSRSRNRWLSLHSPRRPGSSLAHCRRWWALSNGASSPQRKNRGQEIKINHWPKKTYFCHFSAKCHKKLMQGFASKFSEKHIQGLAPPDYCCATMVALSPWGYLRSPPSPRATSGYCKLGSNAFTFLINQTCVISLINNQANQLINYSSLTLTLASREGLSIKEELIPRWNGGDRDHILSLRDEQS